MEIDEKTRQQNKEMLKHTYEMYEKTKKETVNKLKNELTPDGEKKYTQEDIARNMELLQNAQNDIVAKFFALGGTEDELKSIGTQKKRNTRASKKVDNVPISTPQEKPEVMKSQAHNYNRPPAPQESYDVVKLPSKGEAYPSKMSTVSVAYLTAWDENKIVQPNLYRNNLILDELLNDKVLNSEVDPMDMLEGDREAIILFLRGNGYGPEYPITVTDKETGIDFDTVVDLTKLEYKDFNLKGDENGWFDYTLPLSQDKIKFKFLTHRENLELSKMEDLQSKDTIKSNLERYLGDIDSYIDADEKLVKTEKVKVRQALQILEAWKDKIEEDDDTNFLTSLTDRLEKEIMSVNGTTDRRYIHNYVLNMNVRDSAALRKYILANEPGIDYNLTIEKPESLGGGSMNVFLQLDQFIFLNIA